MEIVHKGIRRIHGYNLHRNICIVEAEFYVCMIHNWNEDFDV